MILFRLSWSNFVIFLKTEISLHFLRVPVYEELDPIIFFYYIPEVTNIWMFQNSKMKIRVQCNFFELFHFFSHKRMQSDSLLFLNQKFLSMASLSLAWYFCWTDYIKFGIYHKFYVVHWLMLLTHFSDFKWNKGTYLYLCERSFSLQIFMTHYWYNKLFSILFKTMQLKNE